MCRRSHNAPSVWLAGARLTANCGAIGVTNGEPLVDGPCAEVALKPSSTILLAVRDALIFTLR